MVLKPTMRKKWVVPVRERMNVATIIKTSKHATIYTATVAFQSVPLKTLITDAGYRKISQKKTEGPSIVRGSEHYDILTAVPVEYAEMYKYGAEKYRIHVKLAPNPLLGPRNLSSFIDHDFADEIMAGWEASKRG